jgi:hypothetical protein
MQELLRTTDPTLFVYARTMLRAQGIDCFELDVNMSVLEGSIGILPQRLMVRDADLTRAQRLLADLDIAL